MLGFLFVCKFCCFVLVVFPTIRLDALVCFFLLHKYFKVWRENGALKLEFFKELCERELVLWINFGIRSWLRCVVDVSCSAFDSFFFCCMRNKTLRFFF